MSDPLQEVLTHVLTNGLGQVWTALPGIVRAYDADTQLARVQPAVLDHDETEAGERTDTQLPEIPDVPVCWPRGSSQYLHLGLAAGDEVLLVFATLDPSGWHRTGSTAKAADVRRHHPSHAFAIPGLGSRGRALPDTGLVVSKVTVNETLEVTQSAEIGTTLDVGTSAEIGGNTDAAALASMLDKLITVLKTAGVGAATNVPGVLLTAFPAIAGSTAPAAATSTGSLVLKVGS